MEIINLFNGFRDTLHSFNVSVPTLIACLVIFGAGFLISMRELMLWFFNITALRHDMRTVHSHLKSLEQELHLLRKGLTAETPVTLREAEESPKEIPASSTNPEVVKPKAFRIFH